MAETITRLIPSIEMVRMVNSGTEATMSAIRLARGATGRGKIVKFEGCYHGHGDSFLVKAGSGALTFGVPTSPGVPKATADLTLTLPYNDLDAARILFAEHGADIAALIIEPVAGNMNCILPADGYLQGLRALCSEHGALLIFDEVMTGFRVALGGAQAHYGVTPDLTTFGKIIGGGMPVGAYGGSRALMEQIAPAGPIYQAGTLSGNPVAMAAGLAMLELIQAPGFHDQLAARARRAVRRPAGDCRRGRHRVHHQSRGRHVRSVLRPRTGRQFQQGHRRERGDVQPVLPRHARARRLPGTFGASRPASCPARTASRTSPTRWRPPARRCAPPAADPRRAGVCRRCGYQLPVLGIEAHGSRGGRCPSCSSSIEIRSGERTNAMCPSRGGRWMV